MEGQGPGRVLGGRHSLRLGPAASLSLSVINLRFSAVRSVYSELSSVLTSCVLIGKPSLMGPYAIPTFLQPARAQGPVSAGRRNRESPAQCLARKSWPAGGWPGQFSTAARPQAGGCSVPHPQLPCPQCANPQSELLTGCWPVSVPPALGRLIPGRGPFEGPWFSG